LTDNNASAAIFPIIGTLNLKNAKHVWKANIIQSNKKAVWPVPMNKNIFQVYQVVMINAR
jgi:hypothetical protein